MTPSATPTNPLIVSFVSGKGGVGKTMLAAAFAKELSAGVRTLIIDLDFFNRGLTGLIGAPPKVGEIEPPTFLRAGRSGTPDRWAIAEIGTNLYSIIYPDLTEDELKKFATLEVRVLAEAIKDLVLRAAAVAACGCVVVDCHGGPDNSSFAACLFSRHTLLISEPDRITLYGTLHFVRQLNAMADDHPRDIRLVYNKVVPAFSSRFLVSIYNRTVRKYLQNNPLLAIFPLEVYLTKEFERTTFLTAVYPYSLLAGKTNVIIGKLLAERHWDLVSAAVKSIPGAVSRWCEWSLGSAPALFRLDSLLKIIAVIGLLIFGVVRGNQYYESFREEPEPPDSSALAAAVQRLEMLAYLSGEPTGGAGSTPGLTEEQRHNIQDFIDGNIGYEQIDGLHSTIYDDFRSRLFDQFGVQYPLPGIFEQHALYQTASERARFLRDSLSGEVLSRLELANPPAVEKQMGIISLQLSRQDGSREPRDPLEALYWELEDVGEAAAITALIWALIVLLGSWSVTLDRNFTYSSRRGRPIRALFYFAGACVIWFFPLLLASLSLPNLERIFEEGLILTALWALAVLFLVFVVVQQLWRGSRNFRYDGRRLEGSLRMAFSVYVVVAVASLETVLGI